MPLPATNTGRTPLRLLYSGTALLILILTTVNVAVILNLRESELLSQEGQLNNLGGIMAEQADRLFQSVDLAISKVAERMTAENAKDEASFEKKMATNEVHVFFQEKMNGIPQLDALTLISRDGKLLNFSRTWPVPPRDVTDRDYFKALKGNSNLTSYISEPVQNRGSGTWTIFLARRVNGANGEFLGIILGAIQMRYFEDFYRAISPGDGGTTALQRLDGVMLARFPPTAAIGKTFTNSRRLLRDGVSGTLREPSPIDGLMRIKAAHILTNFPVLIVVTKTEEAALTNWRRIARLMSLGALGGAISIAVAAYAFGRQWKQYAVIAGMQTELGRQEERASAMRATVDVARAMALKMTYSAEHDFLTGLPNRMLLSDRINQATALAHRHKKKVAVLFLDLDGFKHINDSLGHSTGDKLLQSVAKQLVACVRGSDTVSRQGGDEFVVLLSEVEQSTTAAGVARRIAGALADIHAVDEHDPRIDVAISARKMLRAVAKIHSIDRHELQVTASIGVSIYPDDGLDAETLIQNADTAMYQAKEDGPQSYRFFVPEMNVRAVERQFIEESLGQALERCEFTVHYQPVIDLMTGRIIGAEALIRWIHPTRGLVSPMQFIAIAEDCGLMLPIGKWILREACQQAQAWADGGLPQITIAVNISARQFRDENFLENVLATLKETGLDPKYLVLELTESVFVKDAEGTASILRAVRATGARVAIDDFGTGYSSLSYLHRFPVDILKIDQSFVRQISDSDNDGAIVTAVINMAHSLKLRVVAEGVEFLEELKFLRTNQCDEVQGYHFSRPVPAAQFANLLRTGMLQGVRIPTARANSEDQMA